MNIPNQLSLLRIALVPVFMIFLGMEGDTNRLIALAIFIVASLTDALDGHIARKYNLITKMGKLLDPLADKVLVTAALVGLVALGKIPAWIVVLILAREFIVSIFRALAASDGIVIAASIWGKFKTISQMIAIVLLLLNNYPFSLMNLPMDQIVLYIATALTLISGIDYIYKNRRILEE